MDWRKGGVRRGLRKPQTAKYTATVHRVRRITVEAETEERASVMLKRKLQPGETILSTQYHLV